MVQEDWLSYSVCCKEVDFNWTTKEKIIKISEKTKGKVKIKEQEGVLFIEKNSLMEYISYENKMKEECIASSEFYALMGAKKIMPTKMLETILLDLYKEDKIRLKFFEYPIYLSKINMCEWGIPKIEAEKMKCEFINGNEAMKILGFNCSKQLKRVKEEQGFFEMVLQKILKMRFYKKQEIMDYLEKTSEELLSNKEACELMGINVTYFKNIKEQEGLRKYEKIKDREFYYPKNEIEKVIEKQKKQFEELFSECYTHEETVEKLKLKQIPKEIGEKKVRIPLLVKCKIGGTRDFVYKKEDVDAYTLSKQVVEIVFDNAYEEYQYRLKEDGVEFPNTMKKTEKMWFYYAKKQFSNSRKNEKGKKGLVKQYLEATKMIVSMNREMNEISSREMNFSLLNKKNKQTPRTIIYAFLRYAYMEYKKSGIKAFSVGLLQSPYEKKDKEKVHNKELYRYEEYIEILEYANQHEMHKNKVIEIYGIEDDYITSWLYVLMHLNNAWRSYDIACKIPRIDISRLNIEKIEDLQEEKLDEDFYENVIMQLKSKVMKHGKTEKDKKFFCSDKLKKSLAIALCLSELRTRKMNDSSEYLMGFKNKNQEFTKKEQKKFFAEIENEVKFESRKMNRTLLTLVDEVIRTKTKGNSLETTKYLRGHSSIETTNIYVEVQQEHLDFLTEQLFARDHFGFIPEVFAELLYGEEKDFRKRTEQIKEITEKIGDIYKLESIASVMNNFEREKGLVEQIIKSFDEEELIEIHDKIQMELLPSKEENYQCLAANSECIYPGRECHTCPLAIPNYYAISSIASRVIENIVKFNEEFVNTGYEAERTKLANLMHKDLMLLQEAMRKFGKENVYDLMGVEAELFKDALNNLIEHKNYITIRKGV